MKIYLATNNENKRREMAETLPSFQIAIPRDEGIAFNPVEDGLSFRENSVIKARALHEITGGAVIADDSGICVDALGGAPGIYSARYAGPSAPRGRDDGAKTPQEEQNRMLVAQLNEALARGAERGRFPNGPRSARYVCAMTLYLGRERMFVAQETMEGSIVESIEDARGSGGFGYDPLFVLPGSGKTAAELSAAEKNALSHRGKAARVMARIMEALAAAGEL